MNASLSLSLCYINVETQVAVEYLHVEADVST